LTLAAGWREFTGDGSRTGGRWEQSMSTLRSLLGAGLLASGLLSAPHGADTALAQKAQNTIRFGYDQVPENIDPFFNNVRIGVIIGQHVWDTLIYRDPDTNEYKGQLATSWTWADDKTLDVTLRQGVKFHNGEPFDADDVVYTLNFVAKAENKVVTQNNVDWIESAEKLDQFKVRIKLKRTFPAAIEYLAGPVVIHPNDYYAKVGPQGMNTAAVGSGPFRVTEHSIGKYVRMERNKDYFKDSPKRQPTVDKIEIRFIPDRQTQLAEVLSGGLDLIMNVPPDQADQLKAAPHLEVKSGETMRIVFMNLNTLDGGPSPQLKDVRVRRAIQHAIDRETMVKQLVGPGGRVLNAVCFPSQFGCDDSAAPKFKYDPAEAKKLLAEAGLANGFELDLFAYRERSQSEAMVNYLRAVGIKANLRFMQYAAMREQTRQNKVAMAHQTWGSFSVNDVSASTPVYFKFLPDDINRDPEVRDLLEKGDTSVQPEARKEAYRKALALIQERALSVPLYSLVTFYVSTKGLEMKTYPDELPRMWEATWR
jgi:peptide/nickel transport system substrate-binding protein